MTLNLSTLLDIAISMVFVYLTLSLFVSGIVEFINALLDKRSQLLRFALEQLLGSTVFQRFWNHHLTQVKEQKVAGFWKRISYLSANSFSTVLIDLLVQGKPAPPLPAGRTSLTPSETTLATIEQTITTDPNFTFLRPLIEPLLRKADSLAGFKKALEVWYDGYMEQVSGWFKRYSQGVIWAIAIAVTLIFNIDTIIICKRIANDKTLRSTLVTQAEATVQKGFPSGPFTSKPKTTAITADTTVKESQQAVADTAFITYLSAQNPTLANSFTAAAGLTSLDSLRVRDFYLQYLQSNLESLGLPIGWTFPPKAGLVDILKTIGRAIFSWSLLGWILSASALSFGAPFWFELLLKLVNIRNVARRPTRANT